MSENLFLCVRVYASGHLKYTTRDAAGLRSWLNYNKDFRGGCALFVNGIFEERTGVFNREVIDKLQFWLFTEGPFRADKAEQMTYIDPDMGRARYPDEREWPTHFPVEYT